MRYGDGLAVVRQQVPFVTQSEQNFDKYVWCFPAVSKLVVFSDWLQQQRVNSQTKTEPLLTALLGLMLAAGLWMPCSADELSMVSEAQGLLHTEPPPDSC